MKKLDQKGIGHHLLIIIVVVVAVIGAAGYFVWNRQKDSGIEAKAASYRYTDLSTVRNLGAMGSKNSPTVQWYACKVRVNNTTLTVHTQARYTSRVAGNVRVSAGPGNLQSTTVSKTINSSITNLPGVVLRNVNSFNVKGEYTSGTLKGNYILGTWSINSIRDC